MMAKTSFQRFAQVCRNSYLRKENLGMGGEEVTNPESITKYTINPFFPEEINFNDTFSK